MNKYCLKFVHFKLAAIRFGNIFAYKFRLYTEACCYAAFKPTEIAL